MDEKRIDSLGCTETQKEVLKKLNQYNQGWMTESELESSLRSIFVKEDKNPKIEVDHKSMVQPVMIFKCPCVGNKFKLAGRPNDKPGLKEKREYGEYISAGCTVLYIPVAQFREENWEWCPEHM